MMIALKLFGILGGALLFLAIIGRAHANYYLLQYMYFLRVPIIGLILLAGVPILIAWPESNRINFGNWFEQDSIGIFCTTILAFVLAWAIMNRFRLIFFFMAPRNNLIFHRKLQKIEQNKKKEDRNYTNRCPILEDPERIHPYPLPLRFYVFAVAALPTVIVTLVLSSEQWIYKILAVSSGILFAFAIAAFWRLCLANQFDDNPGTFTEDLLGKESLGRKLLTLLTDKRFVDSLAQGYRSKGSVKSTLRGAKVFLAIIVSFYLLGYVLLSPVWFPGNTDRFPALAYLLVLMTVVMWLLPSFTIFLDKFRVPTLTTITAVSLIVTYVAETDYYYDLIPPTAQLTRVALNANLEIEETDTPSPIVDAFSNRQNNLNRKDRIVVVTAAGGGITASFWTTLILADLSTEFGEQFSNSIMAISSTSGGSVGSMFFVNEFSEDGPPTEPETLQSAVQRAGQSSLSAVGWGFAYPDFWRWLIGFSFTRHDRAGAQELIWERQLHLAMTEDQRGDWISPTLNTWRADVQAGVKPLTLFNSTIVETGEQFVIGPMSLKVSDVSQSCDELHVVETTPAMRDFLSTYPGSDLRITTAARLSAAFPVVSPSPRPILDSNCAWPAFHLADGGYYDNYGVLSAIEYLDQLLTAESLQKPSEILLLQVRASDSQIERLPSPRTTVIGDVFSAIKALYSVRQATQLVNNNAAVERFKRSHADVDIQPVVIPLEGEAPLSWHLSDTEKCSIIDSWQTIRQKVVEEISTMFPTEGRQLDFSNICDKPNG